MGERCLIVIGSDFCVTESVVSLFASKYKCHSALDGSTGLMLFYQLSEQRPLVICDSDLPDMSGLQLCRLIKSQEPKTFVMLRTEDSSDDSRISCLRAKADSCIDQSVSDEELRLIINNVYNTLYIDHPKGIDESSANSISDEIFCALEVEVRTLIESYYGLSSSSNELQECSSKYIAECLGRSQRTFQREIKAETGYSFKQLQLVVRLEASQGLFAEGYNVNQVTDMLSFSSPAHFSRAFKDEFGMTPSKYRSQAL